MKLIVGLGNPGREYEHTKHNIGFEVVDLFCREVCAGKSKRQDFSIVAEGRLGTEDLILAKPQTYMNSSGTAAKALISRYDIPTESLYVIYDDFNLDLGTLRIRQRGSAGGHKGVKSIINSLGSQSFPRLRIGIGEPPQGDDIVNYVLSGFSSQEREQIDQAEQLALEALEIMIRDGIDSAMNIFNIRRKNDEEPGDR